MPVAKEEDHQYLRFTQALKEEGIKENAVSICHYSGKCRNGGITYPVIWPREFINKVCKYWGEKNHTFSFMGFRNETLGKREWVSMFDDADGDNYIEYTKRGRGETRGKFDERYWKLLARSVFSVCPPGDCVWTYRLIESCLSGAIPVLMEGEIDLYAGYFTCLKTDGFPLEGSYKEITRENLRAALKNFTFFHQDEIVSLLEKFDENQKDLDISDIYVKVEIEKKRRTKIQNV